MRMEEIELLVSDLHPQYETTKLAERYSKESGIPLLKVQHHISHARAVFAENKIEEGEKPSEGLSKKEKSNIVKKAKAGEDIGKPGKNFEKVATKAAKEYGSKEAGEKVAAAAMFKNAKK